MFFADGLILRFPFPGLRSFLTNRLAELTSKFRVIYILPFQGISIQKLIPKAFPQRGNGKGATLYSSNPK